MWEQLIAEREYLIRVAEGRVHDRATAEDLVHDSLVIALESARDGRGPTGRPGAWLRGILENLLRRWYAVQRRRREEIAEPDELPATETTSPVDEAAAGEMRERLHAIIAVLPARQRDVLRAWMWGHSYAEIEEFMHEPQGTLRNLVFRAQSQVIARLGEQR